MLFTLQLALLVAMIGYLWQRLVYLRRRNRHSWDALLLQMQLYPRDSANPWTRMQYARVSMEMADYAERHDRTGAGLIDPILLASMRREAMEIRLASLRAMIGITQLHAVR